MEILKQKVGKWNRVRLTQTCNGNFKVWGSQKTWFAQNYDAALKKYRRVAKGVR